MSHCVFVPDKELDVLTNGHDKFNTLDDTSEMCISTDCINTDCIHTDCISTDCIYADCITEDCNNAKLKHANCTETGHVIQICTTPIHMEFG